jgi:hypothetical protein
VPLDGLGGDCDVCQQTLQPGLDNSGNSSNLWQDGTSLQDLSGLSPQPADDTAPSYYADDVINGLVPGVVRGAGVIGDGRYITGFYVTSAALGATASVGALWEAGTALYDEGMADLIMWQAGDLDGYTNTIEMIYNIFNGELVPEGASAGAGFGALVGCFLKGDDPCPGILKP